MSFLRRHPTSNLKQAGTIGRIQRYVRWALLRGRHASAPYAGSTKSLEDLDTNDPALD